MKTKSVTLVLQTAETGRLLGLACRQASSRFSEKLCLRGIKWKNLEKNNQYLLLASAYAQDHVYSTYTYTKYICIHIYTHTH